MAGCVGGGSPSERNAQAGTSGQANGNAQVRDDEGLGDRGWISARTEYAIKHPANDSDAEGSTDLQGRTGDAGNHARIGRRHTAGDHAHQRRQRQTLSKANHK